jgi:hypothetical protein
VAVAPDGAGATGVTCDIGSMVGTTVPAVCGLGMGPLVMGRLQPESTTTTAKARDKMTTTFRFIHFLLELPDGISAANWRKRGAKLL